MGGTMYRKRIMDALEVVDGMKKRLERALECEKGGYFVEMSTHTQLAIKLFERLPELLRDVAHRR
jgi:hypothetical protein